MTIDKKTKVDKAIKVANFVKDIEGKLNRITNYSGLHTHVRSIVDNGTVSTETYEDDQIRKASKDWS